MELTGIRINPNAIQPEMASNASAGVLATAMDKFTSPAKKQTTYSWESLLQVVKDAPAGISTAQLLAIIGIVAAIGIGFWLFNKK